MKAWSKLAAVAIGLMVMAGGASAADKKFVIGYTNLADTDVFTMARKSAFSDATKADPNLSAIYTDANGDVSRQLDQIDNFIAQKVSAIVIVPVDYQGIVPGGERANKAGIPVIALGIQSAGGKYTLRRLEKPRCGAPARRVHGGGIAEERPDLVSPRHAWSLSLEGAAGGFHAGIVEAA